MRIHAHHQITRESVAFLGHYLMADTSPAHIIPVGQAEISNEFSFSHVRLGGFSTPGWYHVVGHSYHSGGVPHLVDANILEGIIELSHVVTSHDCVYPGSNVLPRLYLSQT